MWKCPTQSPEVRAHGRALREAVAARRNGRGPAPPARLPLGAGPLVPPVPPAVATNGTVPSGTAAFVHAVETRPCYGYFLIKYFGDYEYEATLTR